MKFLFILLLSICCSASFSQTIINDANAEVRNVTTFSGIKVSGGIDVYLSQSDDYSLAVSASDPKFRDDIKTEIINGVLIIHYDNSYFGKNYGDKRLRVYLSFKTLQSIEGSGACDFYISGNWRDGSVLMKLSGACDVKGTVQINNLVFDLSGASTVKINGTVQNLKLTASGASDIKSYDLQVQNCIAKLSGASDVRVTVNNSIEASASGASTLYYKGNPDKRDVATSGASSISQKN